MHDRPSLRVIKASIIDRHRSQALRIDRKKTRRCLSAVTPQKPQVPVLLPAYRNRSPAVKPKRLEILCQTFVQPRRNAFAVKVCIQNRMDILVHGSRERIGTTRVRGKRDVICVFSSLKITGDAFVTRSVRALWQERVVRGGIPEYHNTGRLAVIQFQPWIKLAESPTKRFKPCGRRAKIGFGSIARDRKIF